MKSASVRDLRYDFKKVEAMLRSGEPVQLTKRNHVIGTIMPPATEPKKRKPLPDFAARMKEIFGDYVSPVTGAEIISQEREERW